MPSDRLKSLTQAFETYLQLKCLVVRLHGEGADRRPSGAEVDDRRPRRRLQPGPLPRGFLEG